MRKLCYSHIIPEFCYAATYRGPHGQAAKVAFSPTGVGHTSKVQQGDREYLLCRTCEGIVNRYETTFNEQWYGATGLPEHVTGKWVSVSEIDSRAFRLFHLSILLRASVAKRCFTYVSLGKHYEEALRCFVREGVAPPDSHYPLCGFVLVDNGGRVMHEIVFGAVPKIDRANRTRAYVFAYAGCEWWFIVTDHPTPAEIKISTLLSPHGIRLGVKRFHESETRDRFLKQVRVSIRNEPDQWKGLKC